MVRRVLILALAAPGVAGAATLTARLDKPAVALGEPVQLTLEARGASLDAFDAGVLAEHFDVFGRTLNRQGDREVLTLTLYPRRAGALHVPALQFEGTRSAPIALSVADGNETIPRVTAQWTLEPATPLVNQPTLLTLAICDDGSLQWRRPPLATASGRVVRALGEDEGEGHQGEARCTLHRYHWALYATRAGAAELSTGMLDAGRFGERLRFPVPSLAYAAQPLPAWLPAHVTPVEPAVESETLPARWPLNRPLAWRMTVTGGYSAEGLRALLEPQLRDTPELGVYPPAIREMPMDDPASPLLRHEVTLFFLPTASGDATLPTLTWPWFDPARGITAGVIVPGRAISIFDPRWQRAARVGAILAGVLLLGALSWGLAHAVRWRLVRRRGLRTIATASGEVELARAVRQFSISGRPAAPSLGAWMNRLQDESRGCDVAEPVRKLEQKLFGAGGVTLPELKQAFVNALSRVSPRRRGWHMAKRH